MVNTIFKAIRAAFKWFFTRRNLQLVAVVVAAPILTVISLIYFSFLATYDWLPADHKLMLQIIRDVMMYIHGTIFVAFLALCAGLVRHIMFKAGALEVNIDLVDEHDGKEDTHGHRSSR